MDLGGGIVEGGVHKYLIGQNCTATVAAAPLTVAVTPSSPTWAISGGDPFLFWTPTQQTATFTNYTNPFGVPDLSFNFKSEANNVTITFEGNLQLPYGALPSGGLPATLSLTCDVEAPDFEFTCQTRPTATSQTIGGYASSGVIIEDNNYVTLKGVDLAGNPTNPSVGSDWNAWACAHPAFQSIGEFAFVQLVTFGRSWRQNGIWYEYYMNGLPVNGQQFLDTYWPYNVYHSSPPNIFQNENDSPGEPFYQESDLHVIQEGFELWCMYKPPLSGSQFVPLRNYSWTWAAVCEKSAGIWGLSVSASGVDGGSDFPKHPTWENRLDASLLFPGLSQ